MPLVNLRSRALFTRIGSPTVMGVRVFHLAASLGNSYNLAGGCGFPQEIVRKAGNA